MIEELKEKLIVYIFIIIVAVLWYMKYIFESTIPEHVKLYIEIRTGLMAIILIVILIMTYKYIQTL